MSTDETPLDVLVIGSGPAGLSAAARARELGLRHALLEAQTHLSDTIFNYQKGKHVMAEPGVLPLRSDLSFAAGTRETVLGTWDREVAHQQVQVHLGHRVNRISRDEGRALLAVGCDNGANFSARAVILAIGLQGNIRTLGVPGERHERVMYTLPDPEAFEGEAIVVVGAGDAAIENALGLAGRNQVWLMNRSDEFGYCKDANREAVLAAEREGRLRIVYSAHSAEVMAVPPGEPPPLVYAYNGKNGRETIACHRVIARLGATPPRKLLEGFGVRFADDSPTALPVLSETFESTVPGLYVVGALAGYPLIKQGLNQGWELVQGLAGQPFEPVDEPLLRQRLAGWQATQPIGAIVAHLLVQLPVFESLTRLQMRELLMESQVHRPARGDVVFRVHDYSNTFYSVISGSVDIELGTQPDGSPRTVTLGPGRFFGEMGLISGRRRNATVRAGDDCVLLETSRSGMLKLIAGNAPVRRRIDTAFARNALLSYVGPVFKPEELELISQTGLEFRRINARELLFAEGDPGDGLYLIRRGSVAVSRQIQGQDRVLSYFSAGQYLGEMSLLDDAPRSASARATVLTEVVVLKAEVVRLRRNAETELLDRESSDLAQFFLAQGLGEASDVLVINENLCIQCNNCQTACAQTHDGVSRLQRQTGATHARIHLPVACRHCEHPHCMKDCPPVAITRGDGGEVTISDACIGCGNCQRNCPYGVIQMAPIDPPPKSGGLAWLLFGWGLPPGQATAAGADPNARKRAVKCDMCSGLKGGPACVRSCPTGAALRMSPETLLKDLQSMR